MIRIMILVSLFAANFGCTAIAGPEDFHAGTVIEDFGQVAEVKAAPSLPQGAIFKVAFDVAEAAEAGTVNRRIESAARLINMHAEAGVAPEDTQIAIVVHGGAAMDLVTDHRYGAKNATAGLISALTDAGVSIELCGQTAAYYDIEASDLLPGVRMSVSAMTAHALLQQDGYTLNPF